MTNRRDAGFIPALDGLRGIAIILVMLHHFTFYRPTTGIDGMIGERAGVQLGRRRSIFCAVRFSDYRDPARHAAAASAISPPSMRAAPCASSRSTTWCCCSPSSCCRSFRRCMRWWAAERSTSPPQWPYWLYLTNFSIADRGWVHGWVDVAWSLAIEEQFYLVWPLVIWLCPPRLVAWLCTAIFVAEVFARSFARAIRRCRRCRSTSSPGSGSTGS